ncbi:E3 ubiquitin-protein ligase HERC2-like [Meleagris gallopavo]|uniref:E3 ubiquitin-protein ligase HERC2-like n=1 Tax=Meleagris gallopavo TaxID=9103 RepID=UPI000549CE03|nr:E3 ubiquitin-protein ligase HERC2-like [Meleagris gallopavo]
MEYNHLQEIPIISLRNRLLLLHHISELFCPCIPMFDLEGRLDETGQGPSVGFDTLRGILISQGKEAAFRKVVQATMVRDRQHGPVVELNRIQVSKVWFLVHMFSHQCLTFFRSLRVSAVWCLSTADSGLRWWIQQ